MRWCGRTGPRRATGAVAPLLLTTALTAALATGCTARDDGTPDPDTSGVVTSTLRVGLTEWSIATGGAVPASGELAVLVTNTGAMGHDLVIEGERGTWRTPVLEPGEQHDLTVTAVAGETLDLICSISGHHAAGMSAELDVAENG